MTPSRERLVEATVATLFIAVAGRSWWVAEDAYISFRYAYRLAGGQGLTFNDGLPVEGFSNPLWVFVSAALHALGLDLPTVVPLVSLLIGVALLVSARRVAREQLGLGAEASLGAMAIAAVAGPFVCWATSGLETMAFAGLFWWTATSAAFAKDTRGTTLGALAGLGLTLIRTEGIAWLLVLGVLGAILRHREGRRLDPVVNLVGSALVGFAIWFGAKFGYYGDWVSNVARAKVSPGPAVWGRGLRYALGWHLIALWPLAVPVGVRLGMATRPDRALWLGALAVATPAWAVVVGGDYMAHFRFVVPSVVPAALAVGWVLQALFSRSMARGLLATLMVVGLSRAPTVNVVLAPSSLVQAVAVRSTEHAKNLVYRGGQFQLATPTPGGRDLFLESQAITLLSKPGDRVVTAAIGINGYYNPDLTLLDLCGLVSPEVAARDVDVGANARPGHEKCTGPNIFFDNHPDLWGVVVEYGLPRAQIAERLRERIQRWRKTDRKKAFAPHLVQMRGPFPGRLAFAAGMKPVDKREREAVWASFESMVDGLEIGSVAGERCVNSEEWPHATRPHRTRFMEAYERDGLMCGGVLAAL